MTYLVAHHQGAITAFWLHLRGALIFTCSLWALVHARRPFALVHTDLPQSLTYPHTNVCVAQPDNRWTSPRE